MSFKESDPDFGIQEIVVLKGREGRNWVKFDPHSSWKAPYFESVSCNYTTYPSSTLDVHQRMKGVFQYRKIVMAIAQ